MLAANRTDKVIGRSRLLRVSTKTRNGLSHAGAPAGSKCAKKGRGLYTLAEQIIISQIGIPNENEKKI